MEEKTIVLEQVADKGATVFHWVEVGCKEGVADPLGVATRDKINSFLGMSVKDVRTRKVFMLDVLTPEQAGKAKEIVTDPIVQESWGSSSAGERREGESGMQAAALRREEKKEEREINFTWSILVSFKPGVTDNVGSTLKKLLKDIFADAFSDNAGVHTATQYMISGDISEEDANRISKELLANLLIERIEVQSFEDWKNNGLKIDPPRVKGDQGVTVNQINLNVSDEELIDISKKGTLAFNLKEMCAIRDYLKKPEALEKRKEMGLSEDPTDVELEALAQTWSEHCQHKIFNALIDFTDEKGEVTKIDSLFDTYIKRVTEEIAGTPHLASPTSGEEIAEEEKGADGDVSQGESGEQDFDISNWKYEIPDARSARTEKKKKVEKVDWLLSVFKDNAGVIKFNDKINLVYKVETHNSPSALEPYGGAMTGIVGVNRDPMGTGMGSKPLINVWGYCFGDPFSQDVPSGMLHPRRVRAGVHQGTIDGGNQSGIPYGRGWEIFDQKYSGKPLVFCGTVGIMPGTIAGKPSHEKSLAPGDCIVMVGGRVGKDGIHGATFSSLELDKDSPMQAVQIGDPITQKKMSDMLIEARDKGLYCAITDNGAGGLSSSVGEMAKMSNGAQIDLEKVPLKYKGCQPWEILLSEAQERMTLAVPQAKLDELLSLAKKRDVEATNLGQFTDSGKFHIKYGDKTVAFLDMDFFHNGYPRYELTAKWKQKRFKEPTPVKVDNLTPVLENMLSRLNICSIEEKSRQYDHEVKGLTVVKPFAGKDSDVPSDAAVFMSGLGEKEGIVLSEGINPFYSDIDTYHMAASCVDEAVRKTISAGGRLDFMAGLDNFCWPRSIPEDFKDYSEEELAHLHYKLAQLVRANQGLYDTLKDFRIPLISGKDSMFNDFTRVDPAISVPPTLLVSIISKINDVRRAVTVDIKRPGDYVCVLGTTFNEMGASEYYRILSEVSEGDPCIGNKIPKVKSKQALKLYKALSKAMSKELINSSHAVVKGGLGVALAKTAFAGGLGIDADLREVPQRGVDTDDCLLFSESNSRLIVTVSDATRYNFEKVIKGCPYAYVGKVREDSKFNVIGLEGNPIIQTDVERLKQVWQKPLRGI
ncbi:phosphoribosylformylglycinamidine synthase subunit PurS [Elusimicrobiota bacterium]